MSTQTCDAIIVIIRHQLRLEWLPVAASTRIYHFILQF